MSITTTTRPGHQGRYRSCCDEHPVRVTGCRDCAVANARYQRAAKLDRMAGRRRTVDAVGTRRRLQGLGATGWPGAVLAQRAGLGHRAVVHITSGDVDSVWATTAEAVREVYDRLAGAPGPSARAAKIRTDAARRGWVHPDRWEGVDLDDPAAQPAPVERPRASRARAHVDEVEHLARCGESWSSVAARLGVTEVAIDRALLRGGRRDVAERLARNSAGRWAA